MKHYWTCQRMTDGVKCGHRNPARLRKCAVCLKTRPARKMPAHMDALNLSYEQYIEINGGERCGICGRLPSTARRLDRDHEHRAGGKPRGLLCWNCNKLLTTRIASFEWLEAAAAYLRRSDPAAD